MSQHGDADDDEDDDDDDDESAEHASEILALDVKPDSSLQLG